MNINFELYRVFYTVANHGNITKASQELLISQPAISKSIKNLEDQLGGILFTRTKKGVILTEEGKVFYEYIKQAMEFIYNAENKFSDLIHLETGTIRIGISSTLMKEFLIPFLKQFHNLYPHIDIQVITDPSIITIPKLRNGLLDIVVLNMPTAIDNDINLVKCREVHDCFAVNKDYPELIGKEISMKQLINYPLILQTKKSNARNLVDNFTKEHNIQFKPQMELASYTLVTEFTKIGLGIGYLTKEYIQKEIQNHELFVLNVKPDIPSKFICIALSKKHIPSFSTKKLVEIITKKD